MTTFPTRPGRDPGRPAPHRPDEPLRCSSCARAATNPVERAELATDWLVTTDTGPQRRRFCRDCVPAGPITDLTCIRCGDGPLLVGDLAHEHDGDTTDITGDLPGTTRGWLTGAGWQLTGPICPDCIHELRRR
ncbi:hypothetical protein ACLFMI_15040 [Pseudonocardia nantongensis]|uniref:hypothetical protein n=1 Tax=Pseudonocardia nantongensis TaxID=1181885 RepID=UPI00397DBE4D